MKTFFRAQNRSTGGDIVPDVQWLGDEVTTEGTGEEETNALAIKVRIYGELSSYAYLYPYETSSYCTLKISDPDFNNHNSLITNGSIYNQTTYGGISGFTTFWVMDTPSVNSLATMIFESDQIGIGSRNTFYHLGEESWTQPVTSEKRGYLSSFNFDINLDQTGVTSSFDPIGNTDPKIVEIKHYVEDLGDTITKIEFKVNNVLISNSWETNYFSGYPTLGATYFGDISGSGTTTGELSGPKIAEYRGYGNTLTTAQSTRVYNALKDRYGL